jgi:small-conductance mechanosensitive channel
MTSIPADPKNEARAAKPIPLEEVPVRAEATSRELDGLLPGQVSRQTLQRIGSEFDRALPEIESSLERTARALAARPNLRILQNLAAELSDMQGRLQPWEKELDRPLAGLRAARHRLNTIAATWEATAEVARREGATATSLALIAAVRGEVDRAQSTVVEWRNQILAVRDRLVNPSDALAASLQQVQSRIEARFEGIFRADQPPLWSAQVRESLGGEWEGGRGPRQVSRWLLEGGQYAREQWRTLGVQIALFVALLLGLRSLRDRARAWAEEDYDLRDAKQFFEQPWAVALLTTILLTAPMHVLAPRAAGFVAAGLVAVAVTWIGRRFMVSGWAPLAWGILILFIANRALDPLEAMPTVERVVLVVEMVGALGFLLWLLSPNRVAKISSELRRNLLHRLVGAAMRLATAILAFAIVAEVAGWGDLASLLGSGVVQGAFLGFSAFTLVNVLRSLIAFGLVLWPLRLLRAISKHRMLVRRRVEGALSLLGVGLWVAVFFGQLGVLDAAADGFNRMLATSVSVGTISISVGDVVAFAVTVWLSLLFARLVNFVLQEDVFTRVHTARGVPYAISGLVRYSLIFLGFFVALSAAGIELSKLTIIVGGLGVGVGFGLQNVVNNFASGLILLFERPIEVGDVVQLPGIWGTVKRIGIRSSVIRTFDGAEVIVPNGMLISDKVTNWTLSDDRRRIELDVGVAYGTPAQRVIDLLVQVAKANPKVLPDPEPRGYFVNFGDSALDFKLRVWIESYHEGYTAQSELAIAIQEALDQAGIGVPFPQRDVHIIEASGQANAAKTKPETSAAPPSGKVPPIRSDRPADDSDRGPDSGA